MKKLTFLLACNILFLVAEAQKINLVKDINPGNAISRPEILAATANNEILFLANDGTNGIELWKSDGTSNGTILLKQINPGSGNGMFYSNSVYANGKLFFIARDGLHGYELWMSDGTISGTKMIKDIYTGTSHSMSTLGGSNLVYFNSKVYFTAQDGQHGYELWCSDGTASGTKMVKDIEVGSISSTPSYYVIANNKLFFIARTSTSGNEIWTTDGTEAGTKMVSDLNVGLASGASSLNMIAYNNKVYFVGSTSTIISDELYSTDGNTTSLVKDINTNSGLGSNPLDFTIANGILFFTADNSITGYELWKTDGTSNGTTLVKDIYPGSNGSYPRLLTTINNKLIFKADDPTRGYELWISDGTSNGTNLIYDINSGSGSGTNSIRSELFNREGRVQVNSVYNDIYYFAGDDGTNGRELWRTDGTDTGTRMVEDVGVNPNNSTSSNLEYIYVDSNNVWLGMSDGNTGQELFLYKAPLSVPPPNGIKRAKQTKKSVLYPNPSYSGGFVIDISGRHFSSGFLQVFDVLGKEIYNQSIARNQSQVSITLPHVSTGLYKVQLQLDRYLEVHNVQVIK